MCSRSFRPAISAVALLFAIGAGAVAAQEVDTLLARGLELHKAGDLLGAVQNYEIALEAQPDRTDIRSNLGAAYVALGRIRRRDRAVPEGAGVAGLNRPSGRTWPWPSTNRGAPVMPRQSSSACSGLIPATSRRRCCWPIRCSIWAGTSR